MSKKSIMQFADTMLSRSAFLRDHCRDLEEYTDPQTPLPISLLGYFGGEIATHFDSISPDEWATLSAMMEEGLASSDEDVGTAVATGLVEGLVHRAEAVENLWPRIEAGLGSRPEATPTPTGKPNRAARFSLLPMFAPICLAAQADVRSVPAGAPARIASSTAARTAARLLVPWKGRG